MHRKPRRNRVFKVTAAGALLALSLAAGGCGNDSTADLANGKALFVSKCGGCHQLAKAGTPGTIGPNLDDAFRQARKDGMGDTIQGVVQKQIAYPSQKLYPKSLVMPAKLVTGMNARDVAAYVASVAGVPEKQGGGGASGGGGGALDGKSLFATNCGSCHTLSAAGTSGAAGPNLDQLKPALARVVKQVTNGGTVMPSFKGTLTPEKIKAIAEYVSENAGK